MLSFCIIAFLLIILNAQSITQQSLISHHQQQTNLELHDQFTHSPKLQTKDKCGILDKNLYIANNTIQTIGFYSNVSFSLIVDKQSETYSFTGLAISQQITIEQLEQKKNHLKKVYNIQLNIKGQLQKSQSIKQSSDINKQKVYFAILGIYSICKTMTISTDQAQLSVKITYSKMLEFVTIKQFHNTNLHTSVIIPANIYCIQTSSIKHTNMFITIFYYLMIVACIGVLIHFNPFKNVPFITRISCILIYLYGSLCSNDWYFSLMVTYAGIFAILLIFKIFQKGRNMNEIVNQKLVLTKSFILVSMASSVPLAVRSHIDDHDVEQQRFILHIINIVMLCNHSLVVLSLVYIQRFRHAFYYFILIACVEHYFGQLISQRLSHNMILPQIFPAQYQCQSFFFLILFRPLCDYFFDTYTLEMIIKFFILLVPLLFKIVGIDFSYSLSFSIWFVYWVIVRTIKYRDLVKAIRFKR